MNLQQIRQKTAYCPTAMPTQKQATRTWLNSLSNPKEPMKKQYIDFSISAWGKKDLIFNKELNSNSSLTGHLYIEHGSLDVVESTSNKRSGTSFYKCNENN